MIIAGWVLLSIPASLFAARMFRIGKEADREYRRREIAEQENDRKAA